MKKVISGMVIGGLCIGYLINEMDNVRLNPVYIKKIQEDINHDGVPDVKVTLANGDCRCLYGQFDGPYIYYVSKDTFEQRWWNTLDYNKLEKIVCRQKQIEGEK